MNKISSLSRQIIRRNVNLVTRFVHHVIARVLTVLKVVALVKVKLKMYYLE